MTMTTAPATTHPAACPHCGGTTVNQAQPDYLLRPAILSVDGAITVGDSTEGSDFNGPCLLVCHGCASVYPQPAGVEERFNDALVVRYGGPPKPGDEGYIGADVVWMVVTRTDPMASYADLLAFARRAAELPKDGEGRDEVGAPMEMENDEAYDTLHELISDARGMLGLPHRTDSEEA